jgi:hypothetical protein
LAALQETGAAMDMDCNMMEDDLLAIDNPSKQYSNLVLGTQHDPQYERVKGFCLQRSQLNFTDAMTQFMDLPTDDLEVYFKTMVKEGIVQVKWSKWSR